jgi:hypothetical protein
MQTKIPSPTFHAIQLLLENVKILGSGTERYSKGKLAKSYSSRRSIQIIKMLIYN